MRNLKITIQYNGSNYCGWQKQPDSLGIQGTIEKAIHDITREEVKLTGSGRTDAGVHALGQVANFKLENAIPVDKIPNALNSKLHDDKLDSYSTCTDSTFCYNFTLVNGETLKLVVEENKITVGNQVYKLTGKTKVVNPTLVPEYIELKEEYSGNNILVLKIPIINELYPNIDFGVNVVYLYNIN